MKTTVARSAVAPVSRFPAQRHSLCLLRHIRFSPCFNDRRLVAGLTAAQLAAQYEKAELAAICAAAAAAHASPAAGVGGGGGGGRGRGNGGSQPACASFAEKWEAATVFKPGMNEARARALALPACK